MKWTALGRIAFLALFPFSGACAQYVENFDRPVKLDPEGIAGWRILAGDGTATMDLRQGGAGYASLFVDGTTDRRGIWWALIEHKVSERMDLSLMQKGGHEFRGGGGGA